MTGTIDNSTLIVTIPNIVCSLAALASLASAVAMLVASGFIAKSAFTEYSREGMDIADELMKGAASMRNALVVFVVVLFVMAADSVTIAGFSRLGACMALCRSYAGALIPALLVTLVSDVACIFRRNTNSTLATRRSTARSFSLWSIVIGIAVSFLFAG